MAKQLEFEFMEDVRRKEKLERIAYNLSITSIILSTTVIVGMVSSYLGYSYGRYYQQYEKVIEYIKSLF